MQNKNTFTLRLLQAICENVTNPVFKEYVNFQPDMFDTKNATPKAGEIDVNGEKVTVRPSKNNDCYVYEFGPALGDFLKDKDDEEQLSTLAQWIYNGDNEFGKILDLADKNDILLFHTSENNKFQIKVGDVYTYVNFLKYQDAHGPVTMAAESINEDSEEDEDWMIMWKNSKAKKEDEPYLDFLNRLKDSY